jgi:4-hydroxy-2-oxoheptanedioate aldolase
MRLNRFRRLLREEQPIICISPGIPSPELVEFLGYLGFDVVFVDAEHGVIGPGRAQEMVRAADAAGVATITRVPSSDPSTILGYLETGTDGVIVPHVCSATDAQRAVQAVKYAPLGLRGAHSATRAASYGATEGAADYFARANQETVVGVMIEDRAALENLDEILAVPGVDLCLIGPGDLSVSMGYPGQPYHPEVQQEVDSAMKAVRAAGIAAGTVAGDGEETRQLFERGFRFALVSVTKILTTGSRHLLEQARKST